MVSEADSLNSLAVSFQDKLGSKFRSPLTAGIGFGYDFKSFRLHASLEWINAVKPYEVLDAVPYTEQTTQQTVIPNMFQSTNSIINYGIGLELFRNQQTSSI